MLKNNRKKNLTRFRFNRITCGAMKTNSRNYRAKGQKLKAKFVEGCSFLTKGKTYVAGSDVVNNRVAVIDDSGEWGAYLASHFIPLDKWEVTKTQEGRGDWKFYFEKRGDAVRFMTTRLSSKLRLRVEGDCIYSLRKLHH